MCVAITRGILAIDTNSTLYVNEQPSEKPLILVCVSVRRSHPSRHRGGEGGL